jgi:polynucleotide 5'-triphosphatase
MCKFESNMTLVRFVINILLPNVTGLQEHHWHYNKLLNARVEEQNTPSYRGARIRYEHSKEIDFFHKLKGQKVRVTREDSEGQKILGVITKTRIADMNVFSPKRDFDFRISVNVEEPHADPTNPVQLARAVPKEAHNHMRWKDRISYKHQLFQIDLTQVKSSEVPIQT